ncbi:hypothetical protein BaRGS_00022140 [Batillaria attramentaria]|uniref:Uncharacterized protein n=1 Tax=Batillaria attramentaria TaxID=370345 RepID=A0ABD0KHE1_9CAEN
MTQVKTADLQSDQATESRLKLAVQNFPFYLARSVVPVDRWSPHDGITLAIYHGSQVSTPPQHRRMPSPHGSTATSLMCAWWYCALPRAKKHPLIIESAPAGTRVPNAGETGFCVLNVRNQKEYTTITS